MPKRNPLYEPHVFKKGPMQPNTREAYRPPTNNAIARQPGHVAPPEPVKSRELVERQKRRELDLCAGYPMLFGLPRDRVMGAAENAAFVQKMSDNPEARLEAEKYALAARTMPPKESDYRRRDNRQVLDPKTHRPLIETVFSDQNTDMPKRTHGLKSFPQAYSNTEVRPEDIPRAARHEMEAMPASYRTNLTRSLALLYPKYTAESRIARQRAAHATTPNLATMPDFSIGGRQAITHSASRMGIAEAAGKKATAEVTSRPNNVRVVALMRTAAATAP